MRAGLVRPALRAAMLILLAATPASARHRAPPSVHAAPAGLATLLAQRQRLQAQRQGLATRGQAARSLAARSRERLDAARRQASADAVRAAALSAATVEAASRVQDTERSAAGAAERTRSLAAQQEAARQALQADADAMAPLLPVIERLSLYPAETLLAAPAGPDDAVAGLMVLRGLGAELERRAQAVRDEQARLAGLGDRLGDEQARLAALRRHQAEQQAQIAARAEAAQAAQRASGAAADRAARDAADAATRATTLDEAVTRIETAEQAAQARFQQEAAEAEAARRPEVARKARASAASLAVPAGPGLQAATDAAPGRQGAPDAGSGAASGTVLVVGRVARAFGERTDAGPAAGVTYAPPSLATVTAPCAGRVDFAGPFRSYGRMMILDCGREYRFVLAGLDRLDVAVGQRLARGAAVGRMPAWVDPASRPSLYVQLRHGDATIDPERFLQHPR